MIEFMQPVVFEVESMNDAFIMAARRLKEHGIKRVSRGMETLEIPNAVIHLRDVSKTVVTLPARNIKENYLYGELDWYESGSLHVKDIAKHSRFWLRLADSNGTVNSNYGYLSLVQKWAGKSQLEWCIERLKTDKFSRQAIINYNQPIHKYPGNKDFVCTLTQSFMYREDGRLHTTVHMRSNDMIYGLTYDAPWFGSMLARVSEAVDLPMGTYYHWADSLHVYDKHYDMLDDIAASSLSVV